MAEGTVKRWLDMRGFGFIATEESEKDIFVHSSAIEGKSWLREGQRVRFDIEESDRGPKAINVEIIS